MILSYARSNLDCLISRRLPAEQRDYAGSLRKERLEAVAQTKLDLTRGRPLAGDPPVDLGPPVPVEVERPKFASFITPTGSEKLTVLGTLKNSVRNSRA